MYAGIPLGTEEKEYLKRWQLAHPARFNLLPKRLFLIGYKIYTGTPLGTDEENYLKHWQEVHTAPLLSGRKHLEESIMELLRKNPKGLTRSGLSKHFRQVKVREVNWYLDQLIKGKRVIAVRRERATRGRQWTPLFFIAEAEIPEEKNVKEERDEPIRQAYFIEGWSINRIARELHHDKRTIGRALRASQERVGAAGIV